MSHLIKKVDESLVFKDIVITDYHRKLNASNRFIFSYIPVSFQRYFRNNNGVRHVLNISTNILAGILSLFQPQILIDYFYITLISKRHYFLPKNRSQYLEVVCITHNDHLEEPCGVKALIFVYGGAWGSGDIAYYKICAYRAAKALGFNYAILIQYDTFPIASINSQVSAVVQAVEYIKGNQSDVFELFHSTSKNNDCNSTLMLFGHSAGANVCALVLHNLCSRNLKTIDYFIGLSGVYNIRKHYSWEKMRSLHHVSPMTPAANFFENFDTFSPTEIVKNMNANDIIRLQSNFPCTMFLHGIQDATVPASSSVEYATALHSINVSNVYVSFPDYDHLNPITELTMSPGSLTSKILQQFRLQILK